MRDGSGRGRFRLKMPPPSGGLDATQEPDGIGEDRLADSVNLWWERGALRTRPGLYSTAERRTALHTTVEASDTYAFGGVQTTGHRSMVGGVPTETVLESFTDSGGAHIEAVRIGADGTAYPVLDDNGSPMQPLSAAHCLPVTSEAGQPLFFTERGVFGSTGTSMEGSWSDMAEYAYVPTLRIGGAGAKLRTDSRVTGTVYEAKNLLTPQFGMRFTTDGEGLYYFLPEKGLSAEDVTAEYTDNSGDTHSYLIYGDETVSATEFGLRLHVDRAAGCVWFAAENGTVTALSASVSGENLYIGAAKADVYGQKRILGMTLSCWFGGSGDAKRGGNRLFLAGNPLYPNLVCWSGVNDALYFPANNYAYVGSGDQPVTALCRQEDQLILFKERELYAAGYEPSTGASGTAAEGTFPLVALSSEVGCDCPATVRLCHGRLVWATVRGDVYTLLSRDTYGTRNVRLLSGTVAPLLHALPESDRKAASAAADNGWYLLLTGSTVWALRYDTQAFVRFSGYTADRDMQKKLCWFRLDVTVPGITWQCILGSGSGAVLYGLQREPNGDPTRRLYTFSGTADCVPQGTGLTTAPLFFAAETARQDLGESGTYKDVTGARLELSGSAARVKVTLTDGEGGIWYSPSLPVKNGCRLMTGLRGVRRVQLKLQGCGTAALSGWELTGTETGEVK